MKLAASIALILWGSSAFASPLSDAIDVCTVKGRSIDLDVSVATLTDRGWRLADQVGHDLVDGYYMQFQASQGALTMPQSSINEDSLAVLRIVAGPQFREDRARMLIEDYFARESTEISAERLLVAPDGETQIMLQNQDDLHCWIYAAESAEFQSAAALVREDGLDRYSPNLAKSYRSETAQSGGGIGWVAILNSEAMSELTDQPFNVKYVFRIYSGR